MVETPAQRRYRDDARLLATIGEHVAAQTGPVTVRLPREVAEAAVRAWQRDETEPPGPESGEQAYVRAFAASLALIGLAVEKAAHGEAVVTPDPAHGEAVVTPDPAYGEAVVTLDPARAAAALFARECAAEGLLDPS